MNNAKLHPFHLSLLELFWLKMKGISKLGPKSPELIQRLRINKQIGSVGPAKILSICEATGIGNAVIQSVIMSRFNKFSCIFTIYCMAIMARLYLDLIVFRFGSFIQVLVVCHCTISHLIWKPIITKDHLEILDAVNVATALHRIAKASKAQRPQLWK